MTARNPELLDTGDFPATFGRYLLVGLLGEGGMARVFRAELSGPAGFRKAAAVKVIRRSLAGRDESLRRALEKEARLGGLLKHPGIVETYDFGVEDGSPFIAMELVDCLPLDDLVRAAGRMPPEVVLAIGAQLCDALAYAHALAVDAAPVGLVHRDLKPANILVSRSGAAKVADFGIAKASALLGSSTATGMVKGTPSYMSPEQLAGEDLDGRSDLFSLATILYELATGDRLQTADSLPALAMAVLQTEDRLADGSVLRPLDEAAPGLGLVLARCLRKDREERYAGVADLGRDLRALAEQLPPVDLAAWLAPLVPEPTSPGPSTYDGTLATAPPVRRARTTPPEPRRGAARTLAGMALIGAIAAAALVVGRLLGRSDPTDPPREVVATSEPTPVAARESVSVPAPEDTRAPSPSPSDVARGAPAPGPSSSGDDLVISYEAPSAGAGRERRRDRRAARRDRRRDRRDDPGTADVAPEEQAASSGPRVLDADYDTGPKERGETPVTITVRADCPATCEVVAHVRPTGRAWQQAGMTPAGDGVWTTVFRFPESAAGHVQWWVEVRDPATNERARVGSPADPQDLVLR